MAADEMTLEKFLCEDNGGGSRGNGMNTKTTPLVAIMYWLHGCTMGIMY